LLSEAWALRAHVELRVLGPFVAGGLVGTPVGTTLLLNLDARPLTAMLGALLHGLESGSPQLFIDNLAFNSMAAYFGAGQGATDSRVDAVFDLYGYLRPTAPVQEGDPNA
jgi:hypothetical protein